MADWQAPRPWAAVPYRNNRRDDQWFIEDADASLVFITDRGEIAYTTRDIAELIVAAVNARAEEESGRG